MVSGAAGDSMLSGSVGPAGGTAAVVLRSSARISSSSVLRSSFEARLNSARLLPNDRPRSGSFRGPKTSRATTKMITSSGKPRGPNMGAPYTDTCTFQYSVTAPGRGPFSGAAEPESPVFIRGYIDLAAVAVLR